MTYKNTRNYNKYINTMKYRQYTITHNNSWCQATTSNNSWCQKVLDLLDLMFAELFYGFPHIIAWIGVWILQRTLWNSDSRVIYHSYQAISIYFDGNSDNFHSLNFSPVFLQWEEKYMNNWWNWTIGWVYGIFKIFPVSTPVKVPKPRYSSHTNSRDKESLNSSTQAKQC